MYAIFMAVSCSINKTELGTGNGEEVEGPSGTNTVSIASLKAMYVNRPVTITSEVSIRGRIISTDNFGNFYKTLCIQDSSGGIAIRVDIEDYFKTYWHTAEVMVYCNTLALGTYGGSIQLGLLSSDGTNTVRNIPEQYLSSAITLLPGLQEPDAAHISIDELGPKHIYTYVRISDVQFEEGDAGVLWCEGDTYTNRTIVDRNGNRLDIRTSPYARFASWMLPSGSGDIYGVVEYFNGAYQLVLPNSSYAMMNSERF